MEIYSIDLLFFGQSIRNRMGMLQILEVELYPFDFTCVTVLLQLLLGLIGMLFLL